ncbi:MAG: AAA family ATPase [Gammaproteobacteria bacterium]|nr:AAA family ATPase [Gammaproteobacteria bacterium]
MSQFSTAAVTPDMLEPDQRQAIEHLMLLDEEAESFTFQTFSDRKPGGRDPLARVIHGALLDNWHQLVDLNRQGAGVFVTVNETNGEGRKTGDITRIRALFQEDDGQGEPLPLEPHIVIQSSPGKHHRYLLVDGLDLDEFEPLQRVLVETYGSDPAAKDRARVLRLAGFFHQKREPHMVCIVEHSSALPYSRDAILQALPMPRNQGPEDRATTATTDGPDPEKITRLIHEVMTGENYHDALNRLAASYARRGIPEPDIVAALQAMMLSHRTDGNADRWQARYDDIPRAVRSAVKKYGPQKDARPEQGLQAVSARDLIGKDFAPLQWNVHDILPAGTMLLFGKPKKGKSFLTLMIAISLAAGRPVFGKATSGRPVLYLGLEDSERRAQRRLKGCANALGIAPNEFGDKLHISTSAKRIDNGLIDELHHWMKAHPDTGLIVIDMLKKVTGDEDSRKSLYSQQSLVGDALTAFCHRYPGLSILVVHHSRKAESDDPFDLVSGTTGLSGSYDSLAAISDVTGTRTFHITGRDIESADIPLLMSERGMYTLQPVTAEEQRTQGMSETRRAVYDAVPRGQAYKRADIIAGCKLDEGVVDQHLLRLIRDGLVKKTARGMYQKTGKRWFDEPVGNLAGFL